MPVCRICGQKTISSYMIEYNGHVCNSCMQRAGLLTDKGTLDSHRCNQLFGGKPTVYEIKQYLDALDNRKNKITDGFMSEDEMFDMAVEVVLEEGRAAPSLLQRQLRIGYARASRIIDMMEEINIIGPYEGSKPRQVLMSWSEWNSVKKQRLSVQDEVCYRIDDETVDYEIEDIDGIEGHEFEYFCAEILRNNGFDEVQVTPGSGDQGADIVAVKEGVRYAIQCKNYASALGNKPVQEVHAAKSYYQCHVAVVMTNSTFTPSAESLAKATGVLLWDGDEVKRLMKKGGMGRPIEEIVDNFMDDTQIVNAEADIVEDESTNDLTDELVEIYPVVFEEIKQTEEEYNQTKPQLEQKEKINLRWGFVILFLLFAPLTYLACTSMETTSIFAVVFMVTISLLFGVLSLSPKNKIYILGMDRGIPKTFFTIACVVIIILMPILQKLFIG